MPCSVGIDALAIYTPAFSLPLSLLAQARGVDPNKYLTGLGQDEMSIMPPDEDIVSMGANAAMRVITPDILDSIKMVMFATETGVDQSKSAGLWLHHLMQLPKNCRVIELKQACYSATCGLKLASSYVREHPDHRVLVVASDNARYGFRTPGEPTQGCAASAFIVAKNPALVSLEPYEGVSSEHIMDFWRPNYMTEAIVDGKLSTRAYLQALTASWQDYTHKSGRTYAMHTRFCYHLPFTKMAEKAHDRLMKIQPEAPHHNTDQILSSMLYSKQIGNGYTAALYIGLASLLERDPDDLSNTRVGFFSYGSGCTGEFFSGIIQPSYANHVAHTKQIHEQMIRERRRLSVQEYEEFFLYHLPQDGSRQMTPSFSSDRFRLKGIAQHERLYEFLA